VIRSRHEAPFETSGTTVHGNRARRRADLEEQLAVALAAGDAARVSCARCSRTRRQRRWWIVPDARTGSHLVALVAAALGEAGSRAAQTPAGFWPRGRLFNRCAVCD
jgi:hypothetical protein